MERKTCAVDAILHIRRTRMAVNRRAKIDTNQAR